MEKQDYNKGFRHATTLSCIFMPIVVTAAVAYGYSEGLKKPVQEKEAIQQCKHRETSTKLKLSF